MTWSLPYRRESKDRSKCLDCLELFFLYLGSPTTKTTGQPITQIYPLLLSLPDTLNTQLLELAMNKLSFSYYSLLLII